MFLYAVILRPTQNLNVGLIVNNGGRNPDALSIFANLKCHLCLTRAVVNKRVASSASELQTLFLQGIVLDA